MLNSSRIHDHCGLVPPVTQLVRREPAPTARALAAKK
jgi:hypothetical protein